jgi:hypothetical protein
LNENKPRQNSSVEKEFTPLVNNYIPLDQWDGKWAFFDSAFKVNDNDYDKIKPLNEEFSCQLWDKFISTKNRHLVLLDNDEWPKLLTRTVSVYNWLDDWNNNNPTKLQEVLQQHVGMSIDGIVLFFWMKECAVETTWEIFLTHWINFLHYDDEGSILLSMETHQAIIFSPVGQTWIGNRP